VLVENLAVLIGIDLVFSIDEDAFNPAVEQQFLSEWDELLAALQQLLGVRQRIIEQFVHFALVLKLLSHRASWSS